MKLEKFSQPQIPEKHFGVKNPESLKLKKLELIKRELALLKDAGIEIESDEKLRIADLPFLAEIKSKLEMGAKPEEQKQIKILIVSAKNWAEKMKQLGSDKQFTGQAWAETTNADQLSIILPSSDVFKEETPYKKAYSHSPAMSRLIAEDPKSAHQNIFLRNILAHEMAHLYQKSDNYEGAPETAEGIDPYEDLQEFMSCTYGLQAMQLDQTSRTKYLPAFLEANQMAIDSKAGGYVQKQAERTVKANEFLSQFDNQSIDFETTFVQMNQICQAGGLKKKSLQEAVRQLTSAKITKETFSQFIKRVAEFK